MKSILILSILMPLFVYGQEDSEKGSGPSSSFSIHTGSLLPNQIDGVTEIMPTWGFRFNFARQYSSIETGGLATNAEGVSLYNAFVSLKNQSELDGMLAYIYLGIDIYYFQLANTTEFLTNYGGHLGAAFAMPIGRSTLFRGDMKFNINPGTSLYIGFGLEWTLSASKEEESSN